MQNSIPTMQ